MRAEGKVVSIAQLCRWFWVPRSTFYYRGTRPRAVELDRALVALVGRLIAENPDYGLRRLTVLVRREPRAAVNRKRIHRILKTNGWQIRQRPRGQRPRAQGWVSRVARPTVRWAIDATQVFCGRDGWCHLTAIIDSCDRTIVGPDNVRKRAERYSRPESTGRPGAGHTSRKGLPVNASVLGANVPPLVSPHVRLDVPTPDAPTVVVLSRATARREPASSTAPASTGVSNMPVMAPE
jgi:hypothetical protein